MLYKFILILCLCSFLSSTPVLAQPGAVSPARVDPPPNCEIPEGAGRLFAEPWGLARVLPHSRYPWAITSGDWLISTASELHQQGNNVGRNIAYETARDIGDGVIAGCMRFTSDINGVVPGGIVFRYQDANNGYGVGFARINGQVVFAIGRSVLGMPQVLAAVSGYDPTETHHVKIVLRGARIRVYLDGAATPVFDIRDAAFTSGKIGYITYSSTAVFGPLWADLDCSAFEGDLSPIGQAVLGALETPAFCSNQYQDLTMIQDMNSGQAAFARMAAAIANAQYEVNLATLSWHISDKKDIHAGNIILQGTDPYNSGLKELYRRVAQNPQQYLEGMRVRILIGGTGMILGQTHNEVLQALSTITNTASSTTVGIPVYQEFQAGADTITWQIEVATFRNEFWSFQYSHAKLLVVDGRTVIAGGYNVHNYYTEIEDEVRPDMGLQVRGMAGFEALTAFDTLWRDARIRSAVPGPAFDPHLPYPYAIAHAPQIWSHQVATGTAVFSLYRDRRDKTSDNAILAALNAASATIDLTQTSFTSDVFGTKLPFEPALETAIRDRNVTVRLLMGSGEDIHRLTLDGNRRVTLRLWKALGSAADKFQVQMYATGASGNTHAKALAIDGQFLIVGSQNWDHAAWGSGGVDLAEYNLGLDGGLMGTHPAIQSYQTYFEQEWTSLRTITPTWLLAGADLSAAVAQAAPGAVIWLDDAAFSTSATLIIDKPLTLVGGSGLSTTLAATGPGPAVRITSGNVTLVGLALTNSQGYALEIGAGSGTPLDNLYIGGVLFADNAQGGVNINVAAGTPLTYTLENNTFVGGTVGIDLSGGGAAGGARLIRNNLFSGQTVAPVRLNTPDDGGVQYTYNLFDQCIRAVGGVCPEDWLVSATPFTPTASHNLINLDSRFHAAASGDYTLAADSPALDAGDPAATTPYDTDDDGDGMIRSNIGALGRAYPLAPTGYVALQAPAAGATVNRAPALQWQWVHPISSTQPLTPTSYRVQVAANGQFLTPLVDTLVSDYAYPFAVPHIGSYYWRVGFTDPALQNIWTPARQFITGYSIYLPVVLRYSAR